MGFQQCPGAAEHAVIGDRHAVFERILRAQPNVLREIQLVAVGKQVVEQFPLGKPDRLDDERVALSMTLCISLIGRKVRVVGRQQRIFRRLTHLYLVEQAVPLVQHGNHGLPLKNRERLRSRHQAGPARRCTTRHCRVKAGVTFCGGVRLRHPVGVIGLQTAIEDAPRRGL